MDNLETIKVKLEQFIRKYYTNELIKGVLLFLSIGLLYLLLVLLIEHFLWLNTAGRALLFWLFVGVELALLARFILLPLFKMFKLSKGLNYKMASQIIGNHFNEVNDKLYNLLQLAERPEQSELLLASIEQKATTLRPVPFQIAVNFRKSFKYARFLLVPLSLFLIIVATGNINWFSESYERVVNYSRAYEPPAPFKFFVQNEQLIAIENQPFTLLVRTSGTVTPYEAKIFIAGEPYYLEQISPGNFEFTFKQPKKDFDFHLVGNEVRSKNYEVKVTSVPTLLNFEMKLNFPAYTGRNNEKLKNTGNATVPEGTRISWTMETRATEKVEMHTADSVYNFDREADSFSRQLRVFRDLKYQLSTSNGDIGNYENLGFSIDVVKDQYPEIRIESVMDSTDQETIIFAGQASDDYGLKRLSLVYYPERDMGKKEEIVLQGLSEGFYQFMYTFPDNLSLEEGVAYKVFFEVLDNDGVNGGKESKSPVFDYRKKTEDERKQEQLNQQNTAIKGMEKSLNNLEKQQEDLREISKTQKEKNELNFNDRKNLENFLNRQELQEQHMKNFTKQLKENLDNFESEKDDDYKEMLKERMERQQLEMEKNEKLLKELNEVADKINKEELAQKLEELAKKQNNNERSLEQLLELTKRYYVGQKMQKIQQDIEKLAREQEELSKRPKDENTSQEQDKLNKRFDELKNQLEELEKENESMKKPMELPRDEETETEVQIEQEYAKQKLEEVEQTEETGSDKSPMNEEKKEENEKSARKSQKRAADKLKKLSEQMEQGMQTSGEEGLMEDTETLRQILDNLIIFSFEQEDLMQKLSGESVRSSGFNGRIRQQRELRSLFEHVDDSLFALSLRRPEVSETINNEITDVYFNIDKALERFPENQMYQGIASQQYTLTASNNLASFLGDVLDNMERQLQMNANGGGQSKPGFQLPDIIQSQEQLNQKMKQQMGNSKGEGEREGQQGKSESEGKQGNKEGDKEGKGKNKGKGNEGETMGQGDYEGNAEQLYEIYKQQQRLRQALEKQLNDIRGSGPKGNVERLVREMEQIENMILRRGLDETTLRRMTRLKHELLKLDKATFEQGEERKRQSSVNRRDFNNPVNASEDDIKRFFNQTENLNRQVLPLRQIYKDKIRRYFKKDDRVPSRE